MKKKNTFSGFSLLWSVFRSRNFNRINRSMIGFSLEDQLPSISRDDAMIYAKATRDQNAHNENYIPPLYVSKLSFPLVAELLTHKDLHVNLAKLVHGEAEIRWIRKPALDSPLKVQAAVKDVLETPVGELLLLTGRIHDAQGLAVEMTSGLLVRGKKITSSVQSREKFGEEIFRVNIPTFEGQQKEYADASGDHNFIHTSELLARIFGLKRTILHGLCTLAMSGNALVNQCIQGNSDKMVLLKARFSYPAYPGQTLSLVGYKSTVEHEILFEVISPRGKRVIRNGVFRHT